jgi:hypothetical protein
MAAPRLVERGGIIKRSSPLDPDTFGEKVC